MRGTCEMRDEGKRGQRGRTQEQEEDGIECTVLCSVVETFYLQEIDTEFILRKEK